jgi:drug/metabolite transporter (DMT)-like permease
MLAATAAFVVGDNFMKIVIEDLPPFEVLFLRGIAASFPCAVLVAGGVERFFGAPQLARAAAGGWRDADHAPLRRGTRPHADCRYDRHAPDGAVNSHTRSTIFLRERIAPAGLALALLGFAGALMVA